MTLDDNHSRGARATLNGCRPAAKAQDEATPRTKPVCSRFVHISTLRQRDRYNNNFETLSYFHTGTLDFLTVQSPHFLDRFGGKPRTKSRIGRVKGAMIPVPVRVKSYDDWHIFEDIQT